MTDVLDRYEALHLEATPGLFVIDVDQHAHGDPSNGPCYAISLRHEDRYIYEVDDADAGDDANAHLIAASRNTVPAVIALAKALRDGVRDGAMHRDNCASAWNDPCNCPAAPILAAYEAFVSALSEEVK